MADQQTPQEAFEAALAALAPKPRRFVVELLIDYNQTQAAIRAGYAAKTARVQASRLLTNVNIKAAYEAGLALSMGADEVLHRLSTLARGTLADFLSVERTSYHPRRPVSAPTEEDPDAVRWVEDPEPVEKVIVGFNWERARDTGALLLLKKFKEGQHGIEIELHDPLRALELIGKAHKLFVERTEHSGTLAVKGYVGVSPDDWDEPERAAE